MDRRAQSRILLVSVVLVAALALGFVFAGSTAAQTADITVDAGGSTNYTSIQAAVDNATAGDVIEVKNGTYRESVRINKSITLVGGSGDVILNGSTLSSGADGITITDNSTVQPMVDGFTITGYEDAVDARDTTGDWVVTNTTITNTSYGVSAFNSSGDWIVGNVTVTNGLIGLDASASSGSWTIDASTVRNASNAGIAAEEGTGNGTVFGTTVTNSSAGVEMFLSDIDVTITESTFANNSIGLSAKDTTGALVIEESTIQNNSVEGLNATGAAIEGDASYNYWGASDGPSGLFDGSGDAVFGEVDISPYYTDETFTDTAGVQPDADPVINESRSSVTPSTVTTNETETYAVNVTVDNTTLTDESGEVDIDFENFTLETGENDLTINYTASNITEGTLSVDASVTATSPVDAGTYAVNLTEIRVEGPEEGPVENGNLTIDTIAVDEVADPVVNETTSSVTPATVTANETEDYTVNVSIDNTTLTDEHGEVDVRFENFTFETGDDLTINYTGSDIDNGTLAVSESINATAPNTTGFYDVNVTDLRVENTSESLINDANITFADIEVVAAADPVLNESRSSVTPTTVTANETETYAVNVTVENTTLTDESGEVDVRFENFTLETGENDLTINYTESNITEGTLSVDGSVTATAPEIAGTYAVNLTEIRVDGPDEGPIENANLTIDTIAVDEVAEPVVNESASSVTPTNITANESTTYTVDVTIDNTTLTDAEGDVNVVFDNYSLDIDDDSLNGPEEDLKINYTATNLTDGTLSVSATVSGRAPTTPGSYPINVTDLEVYGGDGDEMLIEDANVTIDTINVTESTTAETVEIQYATDRSGTVFNTSGERTTSEVLQVAPANATNFSVGPNRSFRVSRPATGESVLVTPNSTVETYNATAVRSSIYGPTGEVYAQPELGLLANGSFTQIDVSVTGDVGMFSNDTFAGYSVDLLDDSETVLGTTDTAVHGIGYRGSVIQNSTSGTVAVSLNRSAAVNASWAVSYQISNDSGPVLTQSVDNSDTDDVFTATFDASAIPNGTYDHGFTIAPSADAQRGERILGVTAFDSLAVGDSDTGGGGGDGGGGGSAPVINTSASSITPNTTTVNETEPYTVDVVIDNTSLTDQHGEVDVAFENLTLETLEDDLTINYTGTDIDNGTLAVSESINATAPPTAGTYAVNVTNLRVENTTSELTFDSNNTVDEIEVEEAADPVINESRSSVTPTTVTANETEAYTVNVTVENTTLTDESGEVDVAFENFTLEGDDDLTINYTESNITDGTLSVTGSVNATAPATAGTYAVNLTEVWINGPDEGPIENANLTVDTIEVDEAAEPVVNESLSSVTPTNVTANETETYAVDVVIDNTTLTDAEGDVNVVFENFSLDVDDDSLEGPEEDLKINYTSANLTDGTLSVSTTVSGRAPTTDGRYPINVTDLELYTGDGDELLIEDANETIDTVEVSEAAEPSVNETASSVTPTLTTANETEEYTVDVTVDNTTLTDESGEVDVRFENFTLETLEDDLTINYTASNITEGTLRVSESVTATAPEIAGTYAVNLTEIRVDGPDEGPIENANLTVGTIEVDEAADPVVNESVSSVTPTNVTANETEEYTVDLTIENASDLYETGDVDVAFDGFDLDLPDEDSTDDTVEEDLSIAYTSANITDGTLTVSETVTATAPVATGEYPINVTDLRPEDDSDPIEDANRTFETITVTEPPEPVVNETASSVTPTNATANDTQQYDVDLTIDNTSLTDESGEVDVDFEAFDFDLGDDPTDDSSEEDLTINYTASNITDGTLSVSASVNATAPNSSGVYNVSVIDLRREGTDDPDASLIEDANITFANISVADSTEALDLTLDESTIPNGTSTNLTATATLTDGTAQDVTTAANLTSSDQTVVTVDNATGVVSAVGQGTALLNASYDGTNATTEVTVGPAAPSSLAVSLGQDVIRSDAETSVTVTAELTNGSTQDVTSLVALESSDEGVVTVDNTTGTATGQGAGSATLTASYEGVSASAEIDVTVPPLAVDRTTVEFGDVTLVNSSVAELNVTNNASTPITVESATLAGNDTDQFEINESAITGEIPAETNRTVEVTFAPFTRTSSNATLNFTASDPALSPANVSLSGTGTATNLTLTANTTSIVAGDPVRFNVTDDDGTPVNATIRLPDATAQTGADGNATVRIETVGEPTATATKGSNTTAYAPDSVQISVVAPTLSVDQTSLAFGSTSLGTTGQTNLTLVNNNATSVEVGTVELFGTNASQFDIEESTVPESVAANAERNVSVRYEPFVRDSATASVDIAGETVSLSGTGVAPQLDITGLPVEITAQQGGSANTTLQISNDGNAPLNATLSSGNDAFSHPGTIDIAAQASETVDIQFAPETDDTGTLSTSLVFASDHPALSNDTVTVTGTVRERTVALRRSEIEFDAVTVGSPVTSTVTVDNTGTTTERLNVTTTNRTLFDLADAGDETITLAPGSSERLTIEANLSSPGVVTETLRIQNDSETSINTTATLNATGQAPALSVATSQPVGFDDTPVNSTSTAEIQLDNGGTAPLAVDLTEAANFSVVGETSFEVPAASSRTVTVGFTPTTAGTATANLTLDTNDIAATAATENVSLEATGFETNLSISEGLSAFDTVGVGGTTSQTLTVANNGTSDLTLSERVTGDFAVTSAPTTIEGETTGQITVQFAPTANGTRTGSLTITGTDSDTSESTTVSTPLVGTSRYGELRINQGTLRTGVTTTDATTTGSVRVENVGLAGTQLSVDDISIAGGNFELDTSGLTEGDVLGSTDSDALSVTFDPASSADNGEQTGTLTLTASSADGAKTVTRTLGLTGIVSAPEPTVSTDQLSVGTVTVDEQTLRTVTVSNDGGEAFEITGVSAGEAGVTADRIGPSRIVPGGESTVVVAVNQSTTGRFDTDVTISTDDDTDLTVGVTGRAVAPELSVSTDAVAFGDTAVGSAGQATVTIRNTGNATLAVAEPTITGSGAGEFSLLSGDRELRIGAGSSQTVSVGFSPSATGLTEASLEIEPRNDPDAGTRTISLNGTGTDAAAELNESAVGFGDVRQTQTVNRTLTLTNGGNAPLEVTGSASILGTDSGAFSVSGLGTPTISPGASETFEIELDTTGRSRGSLSSRVVIPTDDADVTSYLGATVVAPDIETPGTVAADSFGTTRLGTTSTAEVVVNNTGNAQLNLTDLSVTGADADAFSVVETPDNTTVDAQDSGRIVVEFDPSALDNAASRAQNQPLAAAARLNVSSDDPDSSEASVEVALNGEAVTPSLSVPRTFQFGDVPIGQTTTGQLTVENTPSATAPINITDLDISGADAGDYTATLSGSDTSGSLAPGESATVEVNLTPSSFGQKFATLSVATDDTRQPVRKVGLSNVETVYSVSYGSINVQYINPTEGVEPTVNVDRGFQGRNATLRSVNSNVSTTEDYSLNYTFGSEPTEIGHDEALNDTDAGGNVTAVQYINATTSADEGNFTDSTFRTAVSKATLARGNVDPGNVTIYHENGSSYDPLETELLFETQQGYVYEVTTDSYSVFAVGHPVRTEQTTDDTDDTDETDDTDDSTDDSTDDTDDGSTGGGGGGAGPATGGQQSGTTVADIVNDVSELTPEIQTTTDLVDTDPDREGVTVEPTNTQTVRAVTFADETVSGTVSVREYQLDAELTTRTETSVNADLDAAAGTTDSDRTPSNVRLVSMTDISPDSSQATESAATVELTVDREALDDPNNAFVVHETDDGWEQLETTVEETASGTVSLSAETDSFSLFAVVENQPAETDTDGQQTESADDTDTGSDGGTDGDGGTSTVLLLVGVLAVIAVVGAVLAVIRRE